MKAFCCLALASVALAQGAEIYDPVRAGMTEVRELAVQAYEDLLATAPGVSGHLNITFVILPDGNVCDVSVSGSEALQPISGTLRDAVSALVFPPMPEGSDPVVLSVPFVFAPPVE